MKTILWVFLAAVGAAAVAGFAGFKTGADKVRKGIVANYPTIKSVVHSAVTEYDTTVTVTLQKQVNPELFAALADYAAADSVTIMVSYYGKYGIDLTVRNFRVFEDGNGNVEVALPAVRLLYCQLHFDRLQLNGRPGKGILCANNSTATRNLIYAYIMPILEKYRPHQKQAKETIARSLMFYFMPYRYGLNLYIDEQNVPLPVVPGINQTMEEAIREKFGSQ